MDGLTSGTICGGTERRKEEGMHGYALWMFTECLCQHTVTNNISINQYRNIFQQIHDYLGSGKLGANMVLNLHPLSLSNLLPQWCHTPIAFWVTVPSGGTWRTTWPSPHPGTWAWCSEPEHERGRCCRRRLASTPVYYSRWTHTLGLQRSSILVIVYSTNYCIHLTSHWIRNVLTNWITNCLLFSVWRNCMHLCNEFIFWAELL